MRFIYHKPYSFTILILTLFFSQSATGDASCICAVLNMYDLIKIRDMQTGGDITYKRQKLQLASTPQSCHSCWFILNTFYL